jgi:hypothetical protein
MLCYKHMTIQVFTVIETLISMAMLATNVFIQ